MGDCSGDGVNDFSSRDSIISPVITMPSGGISPRLTFDHYVATEAGYDGGNLKVSVNGGDFEAIPAGAYIFNAPKQLATPGAGSSNPLAGEPGFTGTDGGKVSGSWGQSQVDLSALEIEAGDLLQMRFDIGRDGCGGIDPEVGGGWYVDNLTLSLCKVATNLKAAHEPEPSTYGKGSEVTVTVVDKAASGAVTLKVDGTKVGSDQLDRGTATIAVPASLGAGTHDATVSYRGDADHAAGSTDFTITVKKAATSTKFTRAIPKKTKAGHRAKLKVTVDSADVTPGGLVKIIKNGRFLGQGRLDGRGTATIRIAPLNKVGKVKLLARYLGTSNFSGSHDRFTVRIVKR